MKRIIILADLLNFALVSKALNPIPDILQSLVLSLSKARLRTENKL